MPCHIALSLAFGGRRFNSPEPAVWIEGKRLELPAQQKLTATLPYLAGRRFPHHSRTPAGILEAFDQGLDNGSTSVSAARRNLERALERIDNGNAQIEALDSLRRPVRRYFIA